MLSKPKHGWSDFKLEGTSTYGLSYLDDIAFEWLDQAIHGLKTMQPFCVKGFLEPCRFLCLVSYWNCHIIMENDDREQLEKGEIITEYSHTSMLEFCEFLYHDISENMEEWASFADYCEQDFLPQKKELLQEKLNTLKELIISKKEYFAANRCFL